MTDTPAQKIAAAVAAIEAYLAIHPGAADSVQGVAQWWLPSVGLELPPSLVEHALQHMQRHGRIGCRRMPDGQCIWGVAR